MWRTAATIVISLPLIGFTIAAWFLLLECRRNMRRKPPEPVQIVVSVDCAGMPFDPEAWEQDWLQRSIDEDAAVAEFEDDFGWRFSDDEYELMMRLQSGMRGPLEANS
jgi:hypothetical protein